jgi:urease gamma subunit
MKKKSSKKRRITANVPDDLLRIGQRVTGKGITETLVEGLELLRRRSFAEKINALVGKVQIEVNTDETRGRLPRS